MIAEFWMRNFQNHPDTRVELKSGITAITGPTDSGKTSFRRGFDTIVNNDDFHVSYTEEEGEVGVRLDDGNTIVRKAKVELERKKCSNCSYKFVRMVQYCPECLTRIKRKKIEDYYEINGKRSRKAGAEALQEVWEFFNMEKLVLEDGKTKISFNIFSYGEVDSLVDLKPGQRRDLIGSVGSVLVELEDKIKRNNTNLKEQKAEERDCQRDQKSFQTKIRGLDYLEDEADLLKNCRDYLNKVQEIVDEYTEVLGYISEVNRINEELSKFPSEYPEVYTLPDNILEVFQVKSVLQECEEQLRRLPEITIDSHKLPELEDIHRLISAYNSIQGELPSELIDIKKFDTNKCQDIFCLVDEIQLIEGKIEEIKDEIFQHAETFEEENENLKTLLENDVVCKECGQLVENLNAHRQSNTKT